MVHCHAGKHRTGIIVALILSIAGVPGDVIATDYAVRIKPMAEPSAEDKRYPTHHGTMVAMLKHLDDTYGGVEPYLRKGRLTEEHVAALRARLRY